MRSGSARLVVIGCLLAHISRNAWAEEPPRLDLYGDPLPPGAIARLGTVRYTVDTGLGDRSFSRTALRLMVRSPQQTLALLRDKVQPVPHIDAAQVEQRTAQLKDDDFHVREKAQRELKDLGDSVDDLLERAMDDQTSLDLTQRLEEILRSHASMPIHDRRHHRAIAVLEWIGNARPASCFRGCPAALPRPGSPGKPGRRWRECPDPGRDPDSRPACFGWARKTPPRR